MQVKCIRHFQHPAFASPQVHVGTFYTVVEDYSCKCSRYFGLLEFPWGLPPGQTLEGACDRCGQQLPPYPGYYMWPAQLFVPVEGDPLGVLEEQKEELVQ